MNKYSLIFHQKNLKYAHRKYIGDDTRHISRLQPPDKHIMILYEPNDQAMAEAVTDELTNTGYGVRTCGDAGGHQIAAEYVRLLIF